MTVYFVCLRKHQHLKTGNQYVRVLRGEATHASRHELTARIKRGHVRAPHAGLDVPTCMLLSRHCLRFERTSALALRSRQWHLVEVLQLVEVRHLSACARNPESVRPKAFWLAFTATKLVVLCSLCAEGAHQNWESCAPGVPTTAHSEPCSTPSGNTLVLALLLAELVWRSRC